MLRRTLERLILHVWYGRGPAACAVSLMLWPLSFITRWVSDRRRDRIRALAPAPVPVIVVGNLVVGGAGKTPLVASLAKALTGRGYQVGILAGGYRAQRRDARAVRADDDAHEQGDEPVLLALTTGLPVAAGRSRREALTLLLNENPGLDLVISDDGLQHAGLVRSLELAVFDTRGVGNGRLLPAGPLRERLDHVRQMDAVILNGEVDIPEPLADLRQFHFSVRPDRFRALSPPFDRLDLQAFLERLERTPGGGLLALAGIAEPERFFASLRAMGIRPTRYLALTDHAPISAEFLAAQTESTIVMTGKDAVKCRPYADSRCWWLDLSAECEPALLTWLEDRLGLTTARHSGLPDLQRPPHA